MPPRCAVPTAPRKGLPGPRGPDRVGEVKELAQLLNELKAEAVIRNYALFGAVAQMRYTEPVATLDADVLIGAVPKEIRQ